MYYDYKISDINGRNQMYDVIDLNVNTKRCRIMRKDLEQVFKISGVGLDKLGDNNTVRLSERHLIENAMLTY